MCGEGGGCAEGGEEGEEGEVVLFEVWAFLFFGFSLWFLLVSGEGG